MTLELFDDSQIEPFHCFQCNCNGLNYDGGAMWTLFVAAFNFWGGFRFVHTASGNSHNVNKPTSMDSLVVCGNV